MKFALGLAIFCMGWSAILSKEYYSSIFDTIDVDAILTSKRLSDQYVACLLDQGPCTADGRGLRRLLPEAIATVCDKCTSIQKSNARKVLKYMRENRPDIWELFVEKYDPTGQFLPNFETFLNYMD